MVKRYQLVGFHSAGKLLASGGKDSAIFLWASQALDAQPAANWQLIWRCTDSYSLCIAQAIFTDSQLSVVNAELLAQRGAILALATATKSSNNNNDDSKDVIDAIDVIEEKHQTSAEGAIAEKQQIATDATEEQQAIIPETSSEPDTAEKKPELTYIAMNTMGFFERARADINFFQHAQRGRASSSIPRNPSSTVSTASTATPPTNK
jgi:hypothetical protein